MRERITEGETPFRKAYLRSIVDAIEVDDKVICIYGSKTSLEQAVIGGEQIGRVFAVLYANGAPDRIRTCGLCLRRVAL
jgi:hypothetical protein